MKKFNKNNLAKNPIDLIVNFFRKYKIFAPLISIYDKYREGLLYLFFGAMTTLVNILSYILLTKLFNINYMVSNVIAWILSVLFAYFTNKLYVFESKTSNFKELFREISSFFLARVISLGLDLGIMYLGVSVLKFNDMVIKVISNILVIIANYFMSKIFIFKNKNKKAGGDL